MVSIRGLSAALLTWATAANAFCTSAQICLEAVVPQTSSQDLYLQITAPDTAGWAGVGIGSRMRGALIFVIYPDSAGTNLTLSPRIGQGNFEPQYEDSIEYEILGGTGIEDGEWTMNFVCHNCRDWDGGSLDVTSNEASFIFARGGGDTISSSQPDAGIYQHAARGSFTLDLASATTEVEGNPFLAGNNNGTDTDTGNNNNNNGTADDDGGNTNTGGNEDSGNSAPMTKADRTLLAHGMAFVVASAFISIFL